MRSIHFEDLPNISEEIKSFYDDIFIVEGDIFEDCSFDWVQLSKMVVEELFNSIQKLEKFTVLEVPSQVVFEVADIVAIIAKMGVKVEWIYKILGDIAAKKKL